jgi:hypothetical protein
VLCGDESSRFLVYATADPRADEIAVPSALLLLEDVEFYRDRSSSLRALLGGVVANGRGGLGVLRDLLLGPDGSVAALLVDDAGAIREIDPTGMSVEPEHVSTT